MKRDISLGSAKVKVRLTDLKGKPLLDQLWLLFTTDSRVHLRRFKRSRNKRIFLEMAS